MGPPAKGVVTMRPGLLLSPVVLWAWGCGAWEADLPVATPIDWGQGPTLRSMELPSRDDALRRWMVPPSDPWSPYAKYTLLTALNDGPVLAALPDVEQLDEVQRARAAATRIGSAGLPGGTLWIVDLRGAASVAFGAALAASPAAGAVTLVPTFNNWPASDEIVPAEETLAALASMMPAGVEPGAAGAHPVFLLDAWRLAHRFEDPGDETYDNRYNLSTTDLPEAAALRANGIRRVIYVVDDAAETRREEDDLHAAFVAWDAAGIGISLMDLGMLSGPVPDDWDALCASRVLDVEPRVTIFSGPSFYVRARGGFGGEHARPSGVGVSLGTWGAAWGARGGGG